jgi:hypothetical protein
MLIALYFGPARLPLENVTIHPTVGGEDFRKAQARELPIHPKSKKQL